MAEENSIIYSDNRQVVREVNNKQKPKNKKFYDEAIETIKSKNIKVLKIPRDKNYAGIYLEARLSKLKNYGKGIVQRALKQSKKKQYKKNKYGKKNTRKH